MDLHAGQAELPPVSSGITDLYTGQASFRVNQQEQEVPDNDRCANVCVNKHVCWDMGFLKHKEFMVMRSVIHVYMLQRVTLVTHRLLAAQVVIPTVAGIILASRFIICNRFNQPTSLDRQKT